MLRILIPKHQKSMLHFKYCSSFRTKIEHFCLHLSMVLPTNVVSSTSTVLYHQILLFPQQNTVIALSNI